jgi:hypothetical protein
VVPADPGLPVLPALPVWPLPDPLVQVGASDAQAKRKTNFLNALLTFGLRRVAGTSPECPLIEPCKGRLFNAARASRSSRFRAD